MSSVVGEIVRATLWQELRRRRGSTTARGGRGGLVSSLVVFVFAGFAAAMNMARGADAFTGGFLLSSAFMLLFAVFVVMEFATLVTGPDDLAFYTPLPVRPSSYVSAKIAVTFIFGLAFAVAFALPSAVMAATGGMPLSRLAMALAELVDGVFIASLGIIALLGIALRFISYRRVRETALWVQLLLFVAVYAGFYIIQRAAGGPAGVRIEPSPLLLLAPSSWVAVVPLGAGPLRAAGLLLAIAVPALLFVVAVRVVSTAYDGKIADADTVTSHATGRRRVGGRAGLLWRTPEERGMALLIANFFRHDSQFRMGVLTIIPVTVLYVLIIVLANRAPILDPFSARGRAGFTSSILLYLAVGFFPTYLKSAFTYSAQSDASWLFHASPADRLLILRAARRFIFVFFATPYLLLLAAVYAVLTGAVLHTVVHFAIISLLVMIEIDILLLLFPRLPFSRELSAGRRGGGPLLRLLAGVVVLLPIYLLVVFIYPSALATALAAAGLLGIAVALRILGNRHAAGVLAREEFAA